ncbi:MAG: hypothetical protein ACREDO_05995 [Methyloceanibacter sp.]
MIQTNSPQEWVDAAMACGADPHCTQGIFDTHARITDPVWWISTRTHDVDWDKYPHAYPDEWKAEIFAILDGMGRCYRAEEVRS